MKYMGSKRIMLQNGLGDILKTEAESAARIVDLFCGSASVSWFAASNLKKPVIACDLQKYAAVLAGSVIKRTKPVEVQQIRKLWLSRAIRIRPLLKGWPEAKELDTADIGVKAWHKAAQRLCSSNVASETSLTWRCYGGHYYSPTQALSFDAMLQALPHESEFYELCLAATIISASCCVASPGHTAQPFKATKTAAKFLREAWLRDPFHYAQKALETLCPLYASKRGDTVVADANHIAKQLKPHDCVFVDPPYSAVQYSRFYHVLETIARRSCGEVVGVGRYPAYEERPNSCYSRKRISAQAIGDLLSSLATNGCTVVLTFPQTECSNGLSGEKIEEMAHRLFQVKRRSVESRFSTLGGNKKNRTARKISKELILVLKGSP